MERSSLVICALIIRYWIPLSLFLHLLFLVLFLFLSYYFCSSLCGFQDLNTISIDWGRSVSSSNRCVQYSQRLHYNPKSDGIYKRFKQGGWWFGIGVIWDFNGPPRNYSIRDSESVRRVCSYNKGFWSQRASPSQRCWSQN